jgi:hypothetical protein
VQAPRRAIRQASFFMWGEVANCMPGARGSKALEAKNHGGECRSQLSPDRWWADPPPNSGDVRRNDIALNLACTSRDACG